MCKHESNSCLLVLFLFLSCYIIYIYIYKYKDLNFLSGVLKHFEPKKSDKNNSKRLLIVHVPECPDTPISHTTNAH